MKKIIIILYVACMAATFLMSFYVNKHITDDTCYSESMCYPNIEAQVDFSNYGESIMESLITPIMMPIDLYLIINYRSTNQ